MDPEPDAYSFSTDDSYDAELAYIHNTDNLFKSIDSAEEPDSQPRPAFRPIFSRPNSRMASCQNTPQPQMISTPRIIVPSASRQNTPPMNVFTPAVIRAVSDIPTFNRQPSFLEESKRREKSYSYWLTREIDHLFENPEGHLTNAQRLCIILYTFYEVYRTIISSYLIVFVPQKCGNEPCTIYQNIVPQNSLEIGAISLNTLLAVYFCGLFLLEQKREDFIKQYMIIDRGAPTDKESLIQMMCDMNPESRSHILRFNNLYRFYAQGMFAMVCANMCVSCAVVYRNYLNNNTAIVFITNALFMVNRIYKSLLITSSGEYNIYSAYRSDNLLYNRDRDQDFHLLTATNV